MSAGAGRRLLMIEQGGRGGVADYTAALVAALVGEGWQVTLATAADHRFEPIEGVTIKPVFHYIRGDSRLAQAVRARGLGKFVNGARFLAALPRLMRLAAQADVVHSQGWEIPQIGLPAVICLRLAGTPLVQTEHGTFDRTSSFLLARRLGRQLTARLTARTIVHSEADRALMEPLIGTRAVVIPHGEYGGLARSGGGAERGAARAALGIAPDVPVTLMFGQLRSDKGLGDLVAALEQVPGLHLLIGGQDIGGLAEVSERLQALGGRVTVREGFLDMSEAAELFAAADTVALPYRAASQSGVLLLAYGFARPVIIYPVGGMLEAVIDGETGWICEKPDVASLVAALTESIESGVQECMRRGERGHAFAEEHYAWPVIARRTGDLYAEVIGDA
jgi:glycosyltransferase involved in cell wall biosynthesis